MTEYEAGHATSGKRRTMDIPELRRIDMRAGVECLVLGLRDFRRSPQYGLLFGGVYAFGGWLILALLVRLSMPYFAYPAAMGFALIAPFVATGIYEVSRRLEVGQPLSWKVVLGTVWQQKGRDMGWMALITGFAFFIWVDYAAIVFLLFFGLRELQLDIFLETLTTTSSGLYFILLGNLSGAVLATIVFSLTVVSFPLLMDRDIDFVTAMTTSVRAVMANPLPMGVWAAIIGIGIVVSFATVFLALPVILPVLGHGTWHMYRKVVAATVQPEAKRL
jgi:uncharacterized membrane protein